MQAPMPNGEKGNPMLHSEFEQTSLVADLKKEIVEMRGAIGSIDNSVLFPIPFQYYHMGTNHAPSPSGSRPPPPHE